MKKYKEQVIPLLLTFVTFFGLVGLLFLFLHILNLFPIQDKIDTHLRIVDVVVGLTIYLKTAIDFAIFIGNLMHTYQGWKNRIAIEIGTALGNALGTFLILGIWTFFKEVPALLIAMVILASLVLLQMAEDGFAEYFEHPTLPISLNSFLKNFAKILHRINNIFRPLLSLILPHTSLRDKKMKGFWSLVLFAFSIPFVLGLDDFAGYIPLFSIINVFGFATGVFLGHMLLNIFLFTSPALTTKIVRQPVILALGGFVFVGLALWGLYEAFHSFSLFFIH